MTVNGASDGFDDSAEFGGDRPVPAHLQGAGFTTRCVHAGERAERPDFTPTVTPIYSSASFFYEETDDLDAVFANEKQGYVYTRYGNPTIRAFETAVADLEGTEDALSFASGMAAVHTGILLDARAGDRVVAARDVYGATYAILNNLLSTLGIATTFVDIQDLAAVERAIAEVKPTLVVCEIMSNPLLRVANVPALAELAHAGGAKLLVDNTFGTPMLIQPSALGADTVVHSATKYLAGHGDVTGGVIATSAQRVLGLREIAKLTGPTLGAFEAWLIHRGLKTLPLRFRQQCANATAVATWLTDHSEVVAVNYPGQMDLGEAENMFLSGDRGAMMSFELRDAGRADAFRFLQSLKLVVPATTLGDVYSLVLHPASTSHRALTPEQREEVGIREGLIRLSVGIEDVADLTADLDHAMRASRNARDTTIGQVASARV